MDNNTDILHEAKKLRLLAAALELQHLTSTAANVVPIPGTERFVAIGTPAEVARLLAGSAAERPSGDLPALPLDLDTSPARMSIQIKAGELAELIRRWGRDVYASAQTAPEEARNQALEEAAKVAEDTYVATFTHAQVLHDDGSQTRSDIAAAIRVLRTTSDGEKGGAA